MCSSGIVVRQHRLGHGHQHHPPTIYSDSNAALGIAYRRGLGGKTRHVKVQYLWLQGAVADKDLYIRQVGTENNPADMLTKFLGIDIHSRHSHSMGYEFPPGNDEVKAMANGQACNDILARVQCFERHLGIARNHGRWID